MAWDSKTSRRRADSNLVPSGTSSSGAEAPTPFRTALPAKSSHLADNILQSFLSPVFDAADYLNATLPPLRPAGAAQHATKDAVPLAELSTQTQTLLSQLSAHTTRLTNTLTQLTDEILRSGSRLAYEVEVLRGETLGFSEVMTEGLQKEISNFVPGGLGSQLTKTTSQLADDTGSRRRNSSIKTPKELPGDESGKDPEYVTKLRTLTMVRERLDTVIKTFGEAMSWTFPPSEVSVTSAFVSVSAPEPGSEAYSIEEKGQQVSKKFREEIAELLVGTPDPADGIEAAARRIEDLKDLAQVWKGTAEERARIKFVESLAKLVEDRHRELLREAEREGRNSRNPESVASQDTPAAGEKSHGGYGFMNQLQKMRGGL